MASKQLHNPHNHKICQIQKQTKKTGSNVENDREKLPLMSLPQVYLSKKKKYQSLLTQ